MNIIELIEQKYGDTCRLRSPLTKNQCEKAKKFLPGELFDILKVSNGIDEIIINSDNGKTEVIDSIINSLAEIKNRQIVIWVRSERMALCSQEMVQESSLYSNPMEKYFFMNTIIFRKHSMRTVCGNILISSDEWGVLRQ